MCNPLSLEKSPKIPNVPNFLSGQKKKTKQKSLVKMQLPRAKNSTPNLPEKVTPDA